jgi:hypothetical protein
MTPLLVMVAPTGRAGPLPQRRPHALFVLGGYAARTQA